MNLKVALLAQQLQNTELGIELRQQGEIEGREYLITAILDERFGDHPVNPEVAQDLAYEPDEITAHAVLTATKVEDLLPFLYKNTTDPRPAGGREIQ
jgi:hypothetical protein